MKFRRYERDNDVEIFFFVIINVKKDFWNKIIYYKISLRFNDRNEFGNFELGNVNMREFVEMLEVL